MANTQSTDSTPVLKNFVPYKPKKGEQYMNEKQREHFKKILLSWREQLMQEVDRTVHHMQDDAANYPDPADRATQEEEFSLELRTRDREQHDRGDRPGRLRLLRVLRYRNRHSPTRGAAYGEQVHRLQDAG